MSQVITGSSLEDVICSRPTALDLWCSSTTARAYHAHGLFETFHERFWDRNIKDEEAAWRVSQSANKPNGHSEMLMDADDSEMTEGGYVIGFPLGPRDYKILVREE